MKIKSHSLLCILATIALSSPLSALSVNAQKAVSKTWNPNLKNGMYRNPVIDADDSDPDVCRVGNDYYMTSSSFQCFPGLQILHSTDLVNWEIIGAALLDDYPVLPEYQGTELDWRKKVQHGNYVWAPSIRYHDGWFYIYCGDPDQGLFMTKTQDPRGPWEPITWVMKGKGLIDCCPLWDEDGKAYLSHGCAGSRAGIKSVLFVAPMSPDGTKVIGPSRIVYDGHEDQPTIEGTKFYKRNGYYYIMSPAGGVKYGWQVELRSKNPYGPYEEYVGMAQGKNKKVNGPHQGAWVDTQNGEDWFLHFKQMTEEANGIVSRLESMKHNSSIVLYDEGWKKGVIGIVASRLTEIYFRPTIVLTRDGDMATGSARSVTGFDIYSAIKSCRDLLLNFGGHTYAAGLTLKRAKGREFRDRCQHYVEEHISPQQTEPMLNIDAEIDFKDIPKHLQADLKRFSPFGPCNQKPIFCTNRVYDYGTSKVVGREQEHIKLELVDSKSSTVLNGIAFGQSAAARYIKSKRSFDIAFTIEENIFKKNQVQLQIEDIRPNEG